MRQATAVALKGKKAVGVLFSAHWWTPCRAFATDLALFYTASRRWNKKTLEVVFVSSDKNGGAFQSCLVSMPWLAVPYGETAATAKLLGICKVRDIPALVIFDGATGEILTSSGCDDVSKAKETIANPGAVVRRWLNRGQESSERELWTLKATEAVMGIAAV
ncbi:unnamed protein product, partial [Laminaria digitata]